jgi:uncharacterized membrane protein YheB (UPF0754 family)
MSSLLVWLIPPLAGALIGYVTNAVAIKMLFRPLKPVIIFGLRLPFTPGILPRQRHKLANSIGSMVERELLTAETIMARLHRGDVREKLLRSIARYTERALNSPIEGFFSAPLPAPQEGGAGAPEPARDGALRELLGRLVLDFIGSPVFDSILNHLFTALSDAYGRRSIRDILGEAAFPENALEGIIRECLGYASPTLLDLFDREAERVLPVMEASLIRFLKQDDTHQVLETHGRVFLNKTFLRLNVFQRLFISAGQYDRTLHERMPEIIDDLIAQVEKLFDDRDLNRRLGSSLRKRVRSILTGEEGVRALVRVIGAYLDRPLEEAVLQWTHTGLSDLGRRILSRIKAQGGLETGIALGLDVFLENHRGMTLSELFSITDEKKRSIDTLIERTLLLVVDEQIEALLGSINIRTLVSDRIDALDMIKVERIVLDVMANQLKWINLFGAFLGGLIGLFQSAFSRFIN